jgi:hypothetical protein
VFTTADGFSYKGNYSNDKRQGEGVYYVNNGTYKLEHKFVDNEPEYTCTNFEYRQILPVIEVEVVDTKSKKDPKAAAPVSKYTEEEEQKYLYRVFCEYKRAEVAEDGTQKDEGKCPEVSFSLNMLY